MSTISDQTKKNSNRRSWTKTDNIILAVLALLAASAFLWGVLSENREAAARSGDTAQQAQLPAFSDYDGKSIGSVTGTTYDVAILANIPNAKISYFSSYGDMLAALNSGRLDAFCADEPVVRYMMTTSDTVTHLPEYLEAYDFSFAFPKDPEGLALREQFNRFIEEARADGTLAETDRKWFEGDESLQMPPDLSSLTAENGTLRLGTETLNPPFSQIINGEAAGYEIDLAFEFCKRNGYGLEIINYTFDAILPALQSRQCEFAACCFTPTPERAESVYFAEPHYSAGAVLAVPAAPADSGEGEGFFAGVVRSFEKNFIREARWKLILEGIGITCLITVLSALFGTLLAFLICMFRRTDSRLAGPVSDVYVRVFQGTPLVVLLMILYYIIFAHSSVSGVLISIIGFSLNFAAYVSEIMRSGIESVEGGQREAALALGYTERQAFFKFIYPQAAVRFLPVYRGEVVSLLKNTSIVGYIAIMDLTKVSDIIRSRTYEAFFPLIATAVIYFLLAWIISLLLKQLLRRIDPRSGRNRRKEAEAQ